MVSTKKFFTLDVKSADDGSFSGILSTYGNIDLVGDICEKGCFDASIGRKGTHFPCLWNHNDNEPIGSFDVVSTEMELRIKGRFNLDVQRGREAHSLMKAGDVKGMSIGYVPVKFTYDQDGIRHLTEVELFEGSVTPFPANPLATAEAKKMNENFVAFKSALIQSLKSAGKSDDEINKLVEETEKRYKECGEETDRKEEEKPKDGEESTDKPEDESKGKKEGDETPKDNDGEKPTLEELSKALKELADNLAKLTEE